jgi:hypothetical protein
VSLAFDADDDCHGDDGWLWPRYVSRFETAEPFAAILRQISDSSAWPHLVDLPLIIIAQLITRQRQPPAIVKLTLIRVAVTIIPLIANQSLVRTSWRGRSSGARAREGCRLLQKQAINKPK